MFRLLLSEEKDRGEAFVVAARGGKGDGRGGGGRREGEYGSVYVTVEEIRGRGRR